MASRRIALFVMIASVCFLQGCMLHRSAASIRGSLLERTPIGMNYEAVEAIVKKEGWHPTSYPGSSVPFGPRPKDNAGNAPTVEVRQTMQVHLGNYSGLLPFYWHEVYGYWLFDINNQLVEVCVFKRIMDL
jgi:hypothetical protein